MTFATKRNQKHIEAPLPKPFPSTQDLFLERGKADEGLPSKNPTQTTQEHPRESFGTPFKHLAILSPKIPKHDLDSYSKLKKRSYKTCWNSVLEERKGSYQEIKSNSQDPSKTVFCSFKDGRFWLGKRPWIFVFEICMESWVQDGSMAIEVSQFG